MLAVFLSLNNTFNNIIKQVIMFDYLPQFVLNVLNDFDLNKITEIRLRVGMPLSVQTDGRYHLITLSKPFTKDDMENLIIRLTKHSIYAYEEQIKNGYLMGFNGERIGLSGMCVYDQNGIRTIKDFNSLCIRVPHQIKGCADILLDIFKETLKSFLVIAPPGFGKTTFLRDAIRVVSINFKANILVVDEKNEFYGDGKFDLGKTCDILINCRKDYGFNNGILSLRPDLIVTDELFLERDILAVKNAILSGVKVFASAHAKNLDDLKSKEIFTNLINQKLFDYYIILSSKQIGQVIEVIKS